jgi:protein phosphatase
MKSKQLLASLVKKAYKTNADEFIQLVEDSVNVLRNEAERRKSFQVVGGLAQVPAKGKAIILGDIHGDLDSLVHVLEDSDFLKQIFKNNDDHMIFLGDYGDRGAFSAEVYYIILTLKVQFPENVILLQGNHEGPKDLLADPHDLPYQLQERFGREGNKVYAKIRELFNYLCTAVVVNERYLMLHGGVPSKATKIEDLANAYNIHPKETHLEEILWSDPDDKIEGTYTSPRGAGRLFGEKITDKFLEMLNAKVLIRGHEPCEEGFKINHHGKVLTLFSRKGAPYFNDYGAYLETNLSKRIDDATQLISCIRRF